MIDEDKTVGGETDARTFTDEQSALFESGDAPEKTRPRTPGTQSVPPTAAGGDEESSGVSDVG